ncbi:MAG: glycoside hydrolase family 97 catalytic domain-containing protein, partial [Vicinamibacteria bacterium]|nr:glycoside hydrolase family 97 catalytic domain-containing protein [Vicinamibacteria bacterium]
MRRPIVFCALAVAAATSAAAQAAAAPPREIVVISPNTQLVATIAPADALARVGRWRYRLDRDVGGTRVEVLGWSPLGVVRDDASLVELTIVSATAPTAARATYEAPAGKRRSRTYVAIERQVTLEAAAGARVTLTVRVADDSLAFRYSFPDAGTGVRRVKEELTGFAVPVGSRGWLLQHDAPGKWTPAYENFFSEVAAGTTAPTSQGWAYPALFRRPVVGSPESLSRSLESGVGRPRDQWLLITEAAVDRHYAGTRLAAEAPGGVYRVRLPDPGEGLGQGDVEPRSTGVWTLPWRVIITGDLATVFASTVVEDLNPPPTGDFSWVRPGRASFGWWIDDDASKKEDVLKAFIDLAAEMGWEYSLIDANWHLAPQGTIERVVAYAKDKRVGLWLWYNSAGPHNDVTEWGPRDRITEGPARRAEFARLKTMGIAGVKVDFWHSDKQTVISLYHDMMADAAQAGLLIAFHGATTPRGWSRTYPNLLAVEAVLSAEQYKYNERYAGDAAWHNTILAFTRNVIGSMDYLPAALSDAKYPHQTTNAHELALTVVFESGIV